MSVCIRPNQYIAQQWPYKLHAYLQEASLSAQRAAMTSPPTAAVGLKHRMIAQAAGQCGARTWTSVGWSGAIVVLALCAMVRSPAFTYGALRPVVYAGILDLITAQQSDVWACGAMASQVIECNAALSTAQEDQLDLSTTLARRVRLKQQH